MEPPISPREGPTRAVLLGIFAGILCLTLAAYLPAVFAGYVWDDDAWLTENPLIRDTEGLGKIWTTTQTLQYYPLLFTTFWVEYRIWGLDPMGFHIVNIVLHACNAFLVGLILKRLGVPAAWWVAAIFAVHPVHVESVAWVTERKNVLSGVLGLSAALLYLDFDRDRRRIPYALALILFAGAMLAKTASAMLPVALAIVILWRRWPAKLRDVLPLAPFVLIAGALASVTVFLEEGLVDAVRTDFHLSVAQRVAIAAKALLFYPGKLLVPYPLIFNYPRWTLDAGSWNAIWPVVAVALSAVGLGALWNRGTRAARGVVCAACVYAVTILPALGFFNVYAFRYSFVADHFQYLASIGIIALTAAGGFLLLKKSRAVLAFFILCGLGTLTSMQAFIYQNPEILWKDTVAKNRSSWLAQCSLGSILYQTGKRQEALEQFREAARLNPSAIEPQVSLSVTLAKMGRGDEALDQSRRLLRQNPRIPMLHIVMGDVLKETGQFEEAALHYAEALRLYPPHSRARNNLGVVLAQQGKLKEAIAQFQEGCRISPDSADIRHNLEIVLAREKAQPLQ